MNPGKLRHRVRLLREARTPDAGGGGTTELQDGPEVWANVVPLSVQELTEAAAKGETVTHRVEIRHRPDLAPYRAIRFGARVLDVVGSVDVGERREEVDFLCRERR